MNPISK